MISRTRVLLASAVLALLVASPAAALTAFDNLVVFGDSLMDAGNIYAATSHGTPSAASGYYNGRFSNGPVASDVLNQAVEGSLSSPSLLGGDNYAWGGARAVADADGIPDLALQVSAYLAHTGGTVDSHTLYLINIGGNDIRDILLNGVDAATRTAAVAAVVASQVSVLSSLGAQAFLVAGVGNVGGIPEVAPFGPAAQAYGRAVSVAMSNAIFAALPGSVATVDVIGLFDTVLANPAAYGLPAGINLTNACLGSGTPDPSGPPTCTNYAFFDTVHPTTQVAALLGGAFVAAVPEPGTAMLLGLGLVGLALRRRAA